MTQDSSSVELPNVGGSREWSLSLGVGIPHVGAMQSRCGYTTRRCHAVALQGQGLSR